jgi:hypothetical protein
MSSVRAFQPRKIEPPQFVAEGEAELEELEGSFIGGEQCDGCGNSTYRITCDRSRTFPRWYATCAIDPDGSTEFRHPKPCGNIYRIELWDEEEVVF